MVDGLATRLNRDLAQRWRSSGDEISNFLGEVGLTGEEHSQALYILPKATENVERTIQELRVATIDEDFWCFVTAGSGDRTVVLAWPVGHRISAQHAASALYVEVHSRLVSWWLVNAWRTKQLASATWSLGDSDQIIAAAACARSLLETAAAFWVDSRKIGEIWRSIKADTATQGIKLRHWQDMTTQIWQMMWGAKFDQKVPDLAKAYAALPRTNVLSLIEKFQRATSQPVQRDYQWLCNAVHPSIGGMLAFSSPIMAHTTKACAFQFVAPFGTHIESNGEIDAETTIQAAIASAATTAVTAMRETLDASLRVVDDIALTTGAPKMASFEYWRKISQRSRSGICPCRSGRKAKNCLHDWSQEAPVIVEHFSI